jgi:hypothetical protein
MRPEDISVVSFSVPSVLITIDPVKPVYTCPVETRTEPPGEINDEPLSKDNDPLK